MAYVFCITNCMSIRYFKALFYLFLFSFKEVMRLLIFFLFCLMNVDWNIKWFEGYVKQRLKENLKILVHHYSFIEKRITLCSLKVPFTCFCLNPRLMFLFIINLSPFIYQYFSLFWCLDTTGNFLTISNTSRTTFSIESNICLFSYRIKIMMKLIIRFYVRFLILFR